jgi:hypothetical protein
MWRRSLLAISSWSRFAATPFLSQCLLYCKITDQYIALILSTNYVEETELGPII